MKKNISKKLAKRKRKINKHIKKKQWPHQPKPMMTRSNIVYDVDGRHQGTVYGGIGNIHQLTARSGLIDEIDNHMKLLERHLPYYESDHILNICYNYLVGGSCLQDIKLLRNDEAWLDALGASIIPDPTTAGDFLRRFNAEQIAELMEVKTLLSNWALMVIASLAWDLKIWFGLLFRKNQNLESSIVAFSKSSNRIGRL